MEKEVKFDDNNDVLARTNGDKHNLLPDESFWAEDAKEELEEYIESQGIHIRQQKLKKYTFFLIIFKKTIYIC